MSEDEPGSEEGMSFACPECEGSGMAEDGASICPECGGESAMEPDNNTNENENKEVEA
jgi:DnaJ-class molecular chaperone